MRTFYDWRDTSFTNPKAFPLDGRVIIKTKRFWLCWIYKEKVSPEPPTAIGGFIVAPRTVYLYDVYLAKSFWDAFKHLIKRIKNDKAIRRRK